MEFNLSYIGFGLIGIGIIIFLFQIFKGYRKAHGLRKYEKLRDKITEEQIETDQIRAEAGDEDDESPHEDLIEASIESGGGRFSLVSLGFIVILIGIALIGPITQQLNIAQASINNTQDYQTAEMSQTMLKLVPIFFAIAILGIAIAVVYNALRGSGVV